MIRSLGDVRVPPAAIGLVVGLLIGFLLGSVMSSRSDQGILDDYLRQRTRALELAEAADNETARADGLASKLDLANDLLREVGIKPTLPYKASLWKPGAE